MVIVVKHKMYLCQL